MNERITNVRKRAMKSIPQGDPKAGEIHKESMDQTEGEPSVIREAKAIAHYYLNRSLFINDGELVVGDNPRHILDNDAQPAIFGRRSWTSGGWGGITDQVESFFKAGILSWAGNHKTLDYDTVFAIGFHGLSSQIDFNHILATSTLHSSHNP